MPFCVSSSLDDTLLSDCILWPALAMFTFYQGYVAICQGPNHAIALQIYKVCQIICAILWTVFMLFYPGSANGLFKILVLKKCDGNMSLAVILCLVESVLYAGATVLGALCFLKVREVYGQNAYAKPPA